MEIIFYAAGLAVCAAVSALTARIAYRKAVAKVAAETKNRMDVERRFHDTMTEAVVQLQENIKELQKATEDLSSGIVPDFEKAKDAAKAVNDFNSGLSGLLGFNPYESMRARKDGDAQ